MPHINDLSINNIFEGNNGEKWQVVEGMDEENKIHRVLVKLKVEQVIVNQPQERNEKLKELLDSNPLEGGEKIE